MDQSQRVPILPLNQGSLIVIDSTIIGYLSMLKKRRPVPLDTIQKFGSLRQKLAPLIQPGGFPEGTTLFLSHDEFRLIEDAIRGFGEGTRLFIPPSPQRDEVLQELEKLHRYIQAHLIDDVQ